MTARHVTTVVVLLALAGALAIFAHVAMQPPATSAPNAGVPVSLPASCWPDLPPGPGMLELHGWSRADAGWRDPTSGALLDEETAIERERSRR
jgi:hypothetical protein